MRQTYTILLKRYQRYIRYFVIGFIFAALVFGNTAIKLAQTDTFVEPCQPYLDGPGCQNGQSPDIQPKLVCPNRKTTLPCPLDAAK